MLLHFLHPPQRSLSKDEFLSSDPLTLTHLAPTCYNAYWSTMNLYILVSDCHTIMVMMFIDESVCSRVLGDEVFGYCYISCLNVTCVQVSLYISSDILTLTHLPHATKLIGQL